MQIITTLAGANFRPKEARDALRLLDRGASDFRLEREPDNQWDSNAIKIIAEIDGEEHFIGYVAKADNADLALMLDYADNPEAYERELLADGHEPAIESITLHDFTNGPLKPTMVIEISTGWEVGTLVYERDAGDEEDFLPNDEDDE